MATFSSTDRRNEIDLVVPVGTKNAYENHAVWSGFKSIREKGRLSVNGTNDSKKIFTMYPNPAFDMINIQLNNGQELDQVKIYNVLGTHLYTGSTSQIDTSYFPVGMYLVEVTTKTGAKAIKHIIIV